MIVCCSFNSFSKSKVLPHNRRGSLVFSVTLLASASPPSFSNFHRFYTFWPSLRLYSDAYFVPWQNGRAVLCTNQFTARHYWSCLPPSSPSCKTCTNSRQSPGWKPTPVMSRIIWCFLSNQPSLFAVSWLHTSASPFMISGRKQQWVQLIAGWVSVPLGLAIIIKHVLAGLMLSYLSHYNVLTNQLMRA